MVVAKRHHLKDLAGTKRGSNLTSAITQAMRKNALAYVQKPAGRRFGILGAKLRQRKNR